MGLNLNEIFKRINQFYLASFIIIVLILYFIWQIYLFIGFLTSYNEEPDFLIRAENYQAKVPLKTNLPDLAKYNLFGVYKKVTKKTIKASDLKVKVNGIFANSDPKLGTAVITSDGETKLYLVGTKIKGIAVIEEILDDKVIISIDGAREFLPYSNKDLELSDKMINNQDFPPRVFPGN